MNRYNVNVNGKDQPKRRPNICGYFMPIGGYCMAFTPKVPCELVKCEDCPSWKELQELIGV